jgi:hypothetical protein
MEKIRISYAIQGNGINFVLSLDDYDTIKSLHPDAQPSKGVFVQYEMRTNFAEYHPQLEKYVFPALVGFANEEDLKTIKRVEFTNGRTQKITHVIENNYEQKAESLSR